MRRAFLLSLGAYTVLLLVLPEGWTDGFAHMLVGARLAATGDATVLAGIWLPAQHLIYGGLVRLTGEIYWTCRALSPLVGAATVAATYALARRAFPDRPAAAALAALLCAASPEVLLHATFAMPEMPAALCLTLAAHAILGAGFIPVGFVRTSHQIVISCFPPPQAFPAQLPPR